VEHGTIFVTWLAIGLFVVLGAAVIAIPWPRHDWEYAMRSEPLIANYRRNLLDMASETLTGGKTGASPPPVPRPEPIRPSPMSPETRGGSNGEK
jgi:hypothetical protein